MEITSTRLDALRRLIAEHGGKRIALAQAIGKSPTQISQWLSGNRTISEHTAREIESRTRKPKGWMDLDFNEQLVRQEVPSFGLPPVSLAQALQVLGEALAGELPDEVRDDLADALAKLARRKGSSRDQHHVLLLLGTT